MNKHYDDRLDDHILDKRFESFFWKDFATQLNPLYESFKKTAFFILEEKELDITDEQKDLLGNFSNLTTEIYSIGEIFNISTSPNLIIYIYSQSNSSQQKLKQIINYHKSQPQSSLIIYTLDNKKLTDEEFLMAKSYKIANFPDTLIDKCKEELR